MRQRKEEKKGFKLTFFLGVYRLSSPISCGIPWNEEDEKSVPESACIALNFFTFIKLQKILTLTYELIQKITYVNTNRTRRHFSFLNFPQGPLFA
jgi:hypothetical protein